MKWTCISDTTEMALPLGYNKIKKSYIVLRGGMNKFTLKPVNKEKSVVRGYVFHIVVVYGECHNMN